MTKEAKIIKVNHIRNEIAHIYSDWRQGGPDRTDELDELKRLLKEAQAIEVDE